MIKFIITLIIYIYILYGNYEKLIKLLNISFLNKNNL